MIEWGIFIFVDAIVEAIKNTLPQLADVKVINRELILGEEKADKHGALISVYSPLSNISTQQSSQQQVDIMIHADCYGIGTSTDNGDTSLDVAEHNAREAVRIASFVISDAEQLVKAFGTGITIGKSEGISVTGYMSESSYEGDRLIKCYRYMHKINYTQELHTEQYNIKNKQGTFKIIPSKKEE